LGCWEICASCQVCALGLTYASKIVCNFDIVALGLIVVVACNEG